MITRQEKLDTATANYENQKLGLDMAAKSYTLMPTSDAAIERLAQAGADMVPVLAKFRDATAESATHR